MNQRVPRLIDHRYELGDVIGSGGMATVYSAQDTRLGREVALKILRPEHAKDPTFRARFQREAEAVASLNHPAVVAVYDTGTFTPQDAADADATVAMPAVGSGSGAKNGSTKAGSGKNSQKSGKGGKNASRPAFDADELPYIVMERLHGRTLKDVLADGKVSIEDAIGWTTSILDALDYSHEHGVVHRDIKPANVMVLDRDQEDESLGRPSRVKVMDFGIARALTDAASPLTEAHTIMGTARYIAPEQARGEIVDARSDLYSVGCMLYQMLTGRPPFEGETSLDVAEQHLTETPAPPSEHNPEVSEALDSVVLRSLQKSRKDRFQSAEDFQYALDNAAHGISVGESARGRATGATTAVAAGAGALAGASQHRSPYTTDTDFVPQTEDASVSGFFPQAEDEFDEVELYENQRNEALARKRRRRNAWKNAILGLIILLLAATAVGAWMYYQNELSKPVYVNVPSVRNVSEQDAEESLRNEGLKVNVQEQFSDDVASGTAIKTDPYEGTRVQKDSTVTLEVSKGPAKLTIPDTLKGQSEAYVRDQLQKMNLKAGSTRSVNDPSIPNGMVVDTDPGSGSQVDNGSTVNLVLSNGKVQVPDVVGMTQDQARAALTASDVGLSVNFQTESGSQASGTVIRQSSAGGSEVEQGSTITVTVSSGRGTTSTTAPTAAATQGTQDQATTQQTQQASSSPSPSASASASGR